MDSRKGEKVTHLFLRGLGGKEPRLPAYSSTRNPNSTPKTDKPRTCGRTTCINKSNDWLNIKGQMQLEKIEIREMASFEGWALNAGCLTLTNGLLHMQPQLCKQQGRRNDEPSLAPGQRRAGQRWHGAAWGGYAAIWWSLPPGFSLHWLAGRSVSCCHHCLPWCTPLAILMTHTTL